MKIKIKIIILTITVIIVNFIICCNISMTATTTIDDLIDSDNMKAVSTPDETGGKDGIIGGINTIIGLLQLAGSGISIIAVTLLGMKYILASPADKADVKKSIMPIIIGCALLFAGVNIVATIMDFSDKVLPN